MSEQKELIVKEYSLSKIAVTDLKEINAAITISRRQLAGMQTNLDFVLQMEYQRCNIDIEGPKGYKRHITYNTETQKIKVEDLLEPKKKEITEDKKTN